MDEDLEAGHRAQEGIRLGDQYLVSTILAQREYICCHLSVSQKLDP